MTRGEWIAAALTAWFILSIPAGIVIGLLLRRRREELEHDDP